MPVWLWVAVGGAVGSVARYGVGQLLSHYWGDRLPWGTLTVNIVGSLMAGLIWAWSQRGGVVNTIHIAPAYAFGMIGFCGGFTTFSAFSREVFVMLQSGHHSPALFYMLISVAVGILGFWLGFRLMNL